jgi:hypothetical protein
MRRYHASMKKRIDLYITKALVEFGAWLRDDPQGREWIAKEWDTTAMFADVFLRAGVGPDSAIRHQSQIRTESQVGAETLRGWRGVRKDVVIWPRPFMSCWDSNWKATQTPRVVLEFKQWRHHRKAELFDSFDSKWIAAWTEANPGTLGYVVTVVLMGERSVHWQVSRNGIFGKAKSA